MADLKRNNIVLIILEMFSKKELSLTGVCNPKSKLYDVKYLHLDADNLIISFENWRVAYAGKTDKEIYEILIKAYYDNK